MQGKHSMMCPVSANTRLHALLAARRESKSLTILPQPISSSLQANYTYQLITSSTLRLPSASPCNPCMRQSAACCSRKLHFACGQPSCNSKSLLFLGFLGSSGSRSRAGRGREARALGAHEPLVVLGVAGQAPPLDLVLQVLLCLAPAQQRLHHQLALQQRASSAHDEASGSGQHRCCGCSKATSTLQPPEHRPDAPGKQNTNRIRRAKESLDGLKQSRLQSMSRRTSSRGCGAGEERPCTAARGLQSWKEA